MLYVARARVQLSRWPIAVAVIGTAVVVLQVNRHGNLGLGYFYDEMWRVAFIRSPDPLPLMLDHDTPIPLGWVYLMKALTAVLPDVPAAFRLVALLPFPVAAGLWAALLREIQARSPHPEPPEEEGRSAIVAAGAPVLLAALPGLAGYYYLTNYGFEVLYLSVMVLAACRLERDRRAVWALAGLTALSPLFVLGGLFALPAFVVCGLWSAARREDPDDRRLVRLVISAGAVLAGVAALAVYLRVYRTVAGKPSISDWWDQFGATVGGPLSPWELLVKAAQQARDALVPTRVSDLGGWAVAVAAAVVVASAVAGIVLVARRWPWILVIPLSAQVLTIPASVVMSWPVTIERVNLCFEVPALLVVAAGFVHLVTLPFTSHRPLGVAAVAAVLALAFPRPMANDPHDFARGLQHDLDVVADSPRPRNLVIAYHWMSWLYVHDRLVSTDVGGRTFEIVRDEQHRGRLYEPLDRLVDEHRLRAGDRLWCVIPGAVAGDSARACRFSSPGRLREVHRHTSPDSTIVGYEVVA